MTTKSQTLVLDSSNETEVLVHAFLFLYLHNLESNKTLLKDLANIDYQQDEANTDKDIKIILSDFMNKNKNLPLLPFRTIQISFGDATKQLTREQLKEVAIDRVYLPSEITADMKKIIK